MLKKLYIESFKALSNFEITFTPLTVLIGANATGKSSVLQAIDLLKSLTIMDFSEYLGERKRNWTVDEIRSQFGGKGFKFKAEFEFNIEEQQRFIEWEIEFIAQKSSNNILLKKETITDRVSGRILLAVDGGQITRWNASEGENEKFPPLTLSSSAMKVFSTESLSEVNPELASIKNFFLQSDSFELLSPEKMRMSSRGETDSIGLSGEKLAAFIRGLKSEQKQAFIRQLNEFVGFVDDIDTKVKGRPGWIEMSIDERFGENRTRIKSEYISDGLLRIIAFTAMASNPKDTGIMLLDEIEDGINPYLAAKLVESLRDITQETGRQIVVTTHSSVMLDYFDRESIVFMWRQSDGTIKAARPFETDEIREMLEYMYPGEIWLNMSNQEIIDIIQGKKRGAK